MTISNAATCPWKNICQEGLPISATHISRVETCHTDTPTKGELGLQLVGGDGGVKLVLASDGQKGVLAVEVTVNDDISPDDSVAGPGTTAAGHCAASQHQLGPGGGGQGGGGAGGEVLGEDEGRGEDLPARDGDTARPRHPADGVGGVRGGEGDIGTRDNQVQQDARALDNKERMSDKHNIYFFEKLQGYLDAIN